MLTIPQDTSRLLYKRLATFSGDPSVPTGWFIRLGKHRIGDGGYLRRIAASDNNNRSGGGYNHFSLYNNHFGKTQTQIQKIKDKAVERIEELSYLNRLPD